MSFQWFIYYIETGQTAACLNYMLPEYVNKIHNHENKWRPIHLACGFGRLDILKALLKKNCDTNTVTKDKCHAMHIAASYGHSDVVQFLIDSHCNMEKQNLEQERPIHLACRYGWIATVQVLINNKCLINPMTSEKWTPLHFAARYGHSEIVEHLLQYGAEVMAKTKNRNTALDLAIANKHHSSIAILRLYEQAFERQKTIVETRVTVNEEVFTKNETKTDHEWISILFAIENRDLDAFKKLYDKRFLIMKEEKCGLGFLDLLIKNHCPEIMDILLDEDIDDEIITSSQLYDEHGGKILEHYQLYRAIKTKDEDRWMKWVKISTVNERFIMTGESFLEIAVKYGGRTYVRMVYEMILYKDESWTKAKDVATGLQKYDVVKLIEERERYLECQQLVHWNRVHIAVRDNRNDIVQYMLSNKLIDLSATDPTFDTPLELALLLGHKECAKTLLQNNIDINRKNKFGLTALHLAINASMDELVDDLLDLSPDLNIKDMLQLNPLMLAIANGHKEICNKILARKKLMLTDYLKFDKSSLELLRVRQKPNAIPLTVKESYFTFSLKLNGELFDCLKSRLQKSILNMADGGNNTMLHISTTLLLTDLSLLILKSGDKKMVTVKNNDGKSPFNLFLKQFEERKGCIETSTLIGFLKLFLDSGADLLSQNVSWKSLIDACLEINDERIFRSLFSDFAKVSFSRSQLLEVLQRQWYHIIDEYISSTRVPSLRDLLTGSILLKVTENCTPATIDLAISSVDSTSLDDVIEELLVTSARRDLIDIFDKVLKHSKISGKRINNGETVLTSLLKSEKYDYCKRLLSHDGGNVTGCDVDNLIDQVNIYGETGLHVAASGHNMEILEMMLLESTRWDHIDNNGNTVVGILLAKVNDIVEVNKLKSIEKVIKIMIRGGQDLYRLDRQGKPIIYKLQNEELRSKLERFQRTIQPERLVGVDNDKGVCPVCLHKEVDCVLQCGHPFCKDCLKTLSICPTCREPIQRQQKLFI